MLYDIILYCDELVKLEYGLSFLFLVGLFYFGELDSVYDLFWKFGFVYKLFFLIFLVFGFSC